MKLIIKEVEKNQRLDKFLIGKIKNQTRSQIQKMIKQGLILVDNKPVKAHYFLKTGDEIIIGMRDTSTSFRKSKELGIRDQGLGIVPKIIFENQNFLIIDKPVGLLIHPTEKGETNTLVDWLLKKYPAIENVGENRYRAGIIHR